MNGAKACVWEASALPRPWDVKNYAFAALLNEAVNGILVAALMRHADSIVKNYAFGASIFATVGLSAPLLSYWPQQSFFFGAGLVLISMFLYAGVGSADRANGNGLKNGGHGTNGKNGSLHYSALNGTSTNG